MKDLVEIIDYVKPTALLGLSTIKGAFNQAVIERMAALNPRPIIFPLSNPVRLSECEFSEAVEWTNGQVIFASGSPFPEQEYNGKILYPGQGNNMYVFPGIGLGSILSRASTITDSMIEAASLGLANSLTPEEHADGLIYPRISRIRDISAQIALSVIREAQKQVCNLNVLSFMLSLIVDVYLRVSTARLTSVNLMTTLFWLILERECGILCRYCVHFFLIFPGIVFVVS